MRLVFLGAPGVGKGTQADRVSARFHRPKISTGDLLREAVKNKTPLGLEAKSYMDQGKLAPDSVVIGMVRDKLAEPACARGFILDGFPRTVPQAEELSKLLQSSGTNLDRVVSFQVPLEDVIRRLSGRRSCPKCQAVFHVDFAPPKQADVCDRCGGVLVQRSDDRADTIETRLRVYQEQTAPLIAHYNRQRILSTLDGAGSVDSVQGRLTALIVELGVT